MDIYFKIVEHPEEGLHSKAVVFKRNVLLLVLGLLLGIELFLKEI